MLRAIIFGASAFATTATATAQEINFIACPVYRDTNNGRKSGCWLTSDPASGTRYDVTAAPTKADWTKISAQFRERLGLHPRTALHAAHAAGGGL